MAKPGSDQARQLAAMSRRAADLGAVAGVAEEVEQRALVEAEAQLNMRCGGCRRRIGVGLVFSRFEVAAGPKGRPVVNRLRMGACNGADGCDFAEKCRAGADLVEMVEYVWLTGDAPVGHGQLDEDVSSAEDAVRADPQALAEEEAFRDAERLNGGATRTPQDPLSGGLDLG